MILMVKINILKKMVVMVKVMAVLHSRGSISNVIMMVVVVNNNVTTIAVEVVIKW